jgi:acyl carrier protein
MNRITPENVRKFLLVKYSEPIKSMGFNAAELPDSFDFLLSGIIDSFGVLEMVTSIEDEFQIELDMGSIDAEQITILGPLSSYIASIARRQARGEAMG